MRAHSNIIMNSQKQNDKIEYIKETLRPLFDSYKIKRAVLFGSTAKKLDRDDSDIDIVVDGNLTGLKFFGFLEKASKLFENQIDLIEQSQIIKDSKIDHEIKNEGIVIYG